MPLKNHMKDRGQTLHEAGSKDFPGLRDLRERLLNLKNPEDQLAAAKEFGELHKEAELYNTMAPYINEASTAIIDATTSMAVDDAAYLKNVAKSSGQINKAKNDVDLAAVGFNQQNILESARYSNQLERLQNQHELGLQVENLSHTIQTATLVVESLARLQTLRLQPQIKQRAEDVSYQQRALMENLQNGSKASEEFVVRKNYLSASESAPIAGILTSVSNAVSNIGSKFGIHI
jgi:hypothetical protein